MRKKKPWILALAAVSLLSGCGAESIMEMAAVANDPLPVEAPPPPPEEEISYRVATVVCEDSVEAKDGTALVTSSVELPEMTAHRSGGEEIQDPQTEAEEAAVSHAAAFNAQFEGWSGEFEEIGAMAEEDLDWRRSEGISWETPYTLNLTSSVYQTENFASVSAEYHIYTGGAHPNQLLLGWNFDLHSGVFFDITNLAEDGSGFIAEVQEELVRQAKNVAAEYGMAPEEFFWQDYESIIADWTSYAVTFDETGMTVAFSPYELAAYAAGPQVFHVSYAWLEPRLSEHGRTLLGLETVDETENSTK